MKTIDLIGGRFERLTVTARGPNTPHGQAMWVCVCDCGGFATIRSADLRNGHSRSCGCLQIELAARIAGQHNTTHSMTKTPIYAIWRGMVVRCTRPDSQWYPHYGGRGITVCPEWLDFQRFYDDFGCTRPSRKHSIDRRDNDDGYHVDNVRWALPTVQQNNRSDTVKLTFNGETLSVTQWARKSGITSQAIFYRLKRGWPVADAITQPARPHRRFFTVSA